MDITSLLFPSFSEARRRAAAGGARVPGVGEALLGAADIGVDFSPVGDFRGAWQASGDFRDNLKAGNYGQAAFDFANIPLNLAGVALPGTVAGYQRGAEGAVDGVRALARGGDNAADAARGARALDTIDLPAGSRPEFLGRAPNRTVEYQRYAPTKGTSPRMQRLVAAADDPQNPINSIFDSYIEKGKTLGGDDWYNTEELRGWLIDEYGEADGDALWRDYIDMVGATSTGSDVPSNLRNASFYYTLNPADRQAVAGRVAKGGITPAEAAKELGIEVPNMPDSYRYGHVMQGNHAKNVAAIGEGRWAETPPAGLTKGQMSDWLKANPKVKGFRNDLLGSEKNIAADKHFMRLLAMSDGSPDFLAEQAKLSGANLEQLRAKYGKAIEPYIKTRTTGTGAEVIETNLAKAVKDGVITDTSLFKDMPTAWLDVPNDTEYAALEEMAQRLAKRYDMTPAQFQANLWMGAGDLTGLADESQGTFMDLFRRRLDHRAKERGVSRKQQFLDFAARKSPLAMVGSAGMGGILGLGAIGQQEEEDNSILGYAGRL